MSLPLERVSFDPPPGLEMYGWPFTLPVVVQIARDGLDLGPVTVLVGENGSGKSTLVEGLAMAYGLSPEGGSTGARHSTRGSESPLYRALRLHRGIGAARWGFFLRAETMHGFYSYLENSPDAYGDVGPRYHEMSHGESFLEVLASRFQDPGLYLLDEPESALSFTGCLALVGLLGRISGSGYGQVVVATHSPVVAALPGARILEVGDWGLRESSWAELDLVQNWRAFLDEPQQYLRYLSDDEA